MTDVCALSVSTSEEACGQEVMPSLLLASDGAGVQVQGERKWPSHSPPTGQQSSPTPDEFKTLECILKSK
jgi:hypothetical protein